MSRPSQLKRVLSASRRTELLGHYPDAFAERLAQFGPERVHSVVIWTKDPRPLLTHAALREELGRVGQIFLQWTVTGLGGTSLEPNVPPAEEQIALLPEVVGFVGDPRRIHWRYDPLIRIVEGGERLSNIDLGSFRRLARAFAVRGVPAVHASFVTPYPKVLKRLGAAGATLELPEAEERGGVLDGFAQAAAAEGLQLITCCEPGRPTGGASTAICWPRFTPPESPAALTADRASARGAAALSASTSAGTFRVRAAASTATLTPHRGSYGHRSILRLPEAGGRRIDMPACPHCGYEYQGDPPRCPDCGFDLTPAPAPDRAGTGGEYVTLATIDDPAEALVLRASLEEAGVPTLMHTFRPESNELAAVEQDIAEPYAVLLVPADRLVDAETLLEALRRVPPQWPQGLEPEEG